MRGACYPNIYPLLKIKKNSPFLHALSGNLSSIHIGFLISDFENDGFRLFVGVDIMTNARIEN